MSRAISAELALNPRPRNTRLTRWLYQELRRAILERRLDAGCRLPASRDLAREYGISRGTVVTAFERLQAEGTSSVGSGRARGLLNDCLAICLELRQHVDL